MARFSRPATGRFAFIFGLALALLGKAAVLHAQLGSDSSKYAGPVLLPAADEGQLEPTDAPNLIPLGPQGTNPNGPRWRQPPLGSGLGKGLTGDRAQRTSARTPMLQAADGEPADPAARRLSAPTSGAPGSGQALIMQAYAKSREAANEADYTETIELCRDGMHGGVKGPTAAYARRLMAWSHNRRGELRAAAGHDNQAFEDFDAAVDLDNKAWRALHNRGVSLAAMGKQTEALADFSRTIDINPEFPIVYFNRGEMRYELGDFEGALEDYDTAARLLPSDAGVFNSRGHAHYRLKHFKLAVADFNKAIKLDPEGAAPYINRGDVYADLGYFAEAKRDYQEAIRIRPQMGRAYQSAAWLMATCPKAEFRDSGEALDAAQKAIDLDGSGNHRYLATLAAALANAGKFSAAEKIQKKAVAAAPPESRPVQEKRLALYRSEKPFYTAPVEAQSRSAGQIRNAPQSTSRR